jgi:ADP-ribose pyrophosphatase YjhB (NUDIX family)
VQLAEKHAHATQVEIRNAVAIVIERPDGAFLSVRRPSNDPHLPDVWGLPAANVAPNETPEEAAVRAAADKLGVRVRVKRRIGCETVGRPTFALHLTEYQVELLEGTPRVPQRDRSMTQYVASRYTTDLRSLIDAARRGSACCRIFLRDRGLNWETRAVH